ncbi:hypothetical protein ACHMW6_00240 (plasmid) [Pseudoduganella sp. UC29_106]|uniref:ATP-dependent DNA ligase n=1 Tax=Pseudoduganella sp. UC29_106 TaxID=3374553 RepID=UPI003757C2F2
MLTIDTLRPQLLDQRRQPPEDQSRYVAEVKYDGWRVTAGFGEGRSQLRTKEGNDCTRRFQEVSDALAALRWGATITDGEMVVLDEMGAVTLMRCRPERSTGDARPATRP